MSEGKVAREVAEAEFERMCAARRVSTDAEDMDADDAAQFATIRKRVLRAMVTGALVVTADGDPEYTPPVPGAKTLKFHKPTGATYMAMDPKGDDGIGGQARAIRAITEMTRSSRGEISKLDAPDYQLCGALFQLFLAER